MYSPALFKKSNKEMTKIKVIDNDELYNFVDDNFFIWNILLSQKSIWISHILNFKFRIVKKKLDGEMTKTNIVDLNEFYNFVVDYFFIWNHLLAQNNIWICHILNYSLHKRRFRVK
jgi:hypothetical protein